jgi:hypothetical protein
MGLRKAMDSLALARLSPWHWQMAFKSQPYRSTVGWLGGKSEFNATFHCGR